MLAIASLVIGLGPLLTRRPSGFLFAGGLLAAVLWCTGQGWLGGIFSGSGTDPNTGPLIIVLALAMVPERLRPPDPPRPSPFTVLLRRRPAFSIGRAAVIGAGLPRQRDVPGVGPGDGRERHGRHADGPIGLRRVRLRKR